MTALRTWFDARSLREKRLLVAMAALALLTFAWAGVILPVGDALSSARERYGDAAERVGATEAQVAALTRARHDRPRPLTGALDANVRERAERAGFTLQTLNQIGPDRVQLGIASARAGALLVWIAALERAGIIVQSLSTTDNGDRTVAVQMTLAARPA